MHQCPTHTHTQMPDSHAPNTLSQIPRSSENLSEQRRADDDAAVELAQQVQSPQVAELKGIQQNTLSESSNAGMLNCGKDYP